MQHKFDWGLYPEAEKLLDYSISKFLKSNAFARNLAEKMNRDTSTRFFDWIDHMVLSEKDVGEKKITGVGFEEKTGVLAPDGYRVFSNSNTILFPVLLGKKTEIALKPEILEHFIQSAGTGNTIDGEMFSPFRRSVINESKGFVLSAVERRGYDGFVVKKSKDTENYKDVLESFFCRKRRFDDDHEGMMHTKRLVQKSVKKVKSERVADAFFRAERVYWQSRNRAGQVQKARQDSLGLGWGNHDHHTYRCSRENFTHLVETFEDMGYKCREQFHAGEQAGWGAQVMEHPICNIVVFSDVDLDIKEKDDDFAHIGLEHKKDMGTVGLWVALHGESILQAGMHHLEARFEFESLVNDLGKMNINTLQPFSNFKFLKQAFTQSDKWPVEESRLKKLLSDGSITRKQYKQFKEEGARGSHLENLQRREGYKGFNQDSVSAVIKATDPRIVKAKGAKETRYA